MADWHEPVPVPFLVVKKTSLVFRIAPRKHDDSSQLEKIFDALSNALTWLGAGAKTAAGYGYMIEDPNYAKELAEILADEQKKHLRASMSGHQLSIEALADKLEKKQKGKVREIIGGELYGDLKSMIGKAVDESWTSDDKQKLQEISKAILVYINAGGNKKAKELLKSLNS
ncbi:hypothetical protein [Methylotuvimicrobium alcaliphilum]|uniref:Type III-B CRISPR module RAMP protein Cmr6 n=1 Tax=Methylotuvimicrobium alcaliphilum (strain DSM 19304 / NCIMB 14124 / VKM B-2133 / 20Z) TaxID=1091494 RepID=G4T435_META2|nr:hypothetical protein [Methylotuvimicrobium alcaliphilum]CCE23770.1 protein of unknown function [Methylotuvimicrobium alcaliphilum 20Z]